MVTPVQDPLIIHNRETFKFEPLLAKSWKRISPTILEFNLRDDIKFHDGSDFDADDVVYTLSWLIDPKVKLRFKGSYNWIKRAEKIDRYTVRVHSKKPYGPGMARLSLTIRMFPSDAHGALKTKSDFGKKPIGTGPYKVVFVDTNRGVKLVKNKAYRHATAAKPAASIGTVIGRAIPDLQSQIAQMKIGKLDWMHGVPKDLATAILADPRFTVSTTRGINFFYMGIDASGRSKNKALSNKNVRLAMMKAVDRKLIAEQVIPGGTKEHLIPALCNRVQVGCDYSTKPPAFDLAGAKKLLAEAGYPNGFDVVINSFPGGYQVAEAVGGELRKVGIRAKIQKFGFAAYRKAQRVGKQEMLVTYWSGSGGLPDASGTLNYWFSKSRKGKWSGRNFWHDDIINDLRVKGENTLDPAKRRVIYKQAYDRAIDERYIMPIALRPGVFIHTKDIKMGKFGMTSIGTDLLKISWK